MRYWLLCGKLKVIENLAYVYHIGGKTMGIKTPKFEKIMRDAIRVISDLSNRLEKAEKERDDALELLHSYRHICGETPPERLRELVQADQEGRYIIMRDAERNGVARLKELSEANREGRCVVLPIKPDSYAYACCEDFPDPIKYYYPIASMILADIERGYSIAYDKKQAESALKAMKERE